MGTAVTLELGSALLCDPEMLIVLLRVVIPL